MKWPFGDRPSRWAVFVIPPLVALLIGIAVAVASSPSSLSRAVGGGSAAKPTPSPSPADPSPPPPSVTSAGLLGDGAHLVVGGSGALLGLGPSLVEESTDGGKTWLVVKPPSSGFGVAVDPTDPRHAVAGGSAVQVTTDGGTSWKESRTRPPGLGPYQPIRISPFDGNVWFLVHQQKLLRTRDAAMSWRDLTGLPALTAPVIVPGTLVGQFFVAAGSRVFELVDNGQQILELAGLPPGVTVSELAVVSGDPPSLLARVGKDSAYILKGTSWSPTGGGLGGPVAVAAKGGTLLVGNGGSKLGSPGVLSYSSDGGTTWSNAIGLPYDQSVEAISGQPNSTGLYAYCYGGDLYTSTDGGRSWTLLTKALRTTTG